MKEAVKLLQSIDPLLALMGTVCAVIVFIFSTFATIGYVNTLHEQVVKSMDKISVDTKDTKVMIIDMYRDQLKKLPPKSAE